MRYPTDMIDSSMDYFKIEILKNIKQGGGFGSISALSSGSRAAQISDQYASEGAKKTIILPIPGNIQDNNGAQWGENKLNDFAAAALGIVGSVVETDNLKDIPGNVTKKMTELQSGGGGSQLEPIHRQPVRGQSLQDRPDKECCGLQAHHLRHCGGKNLQEAGLQAGP